MSENAEDKTIENAISDFELFRGVFDYDKETGSLLWAIDIGKMKKGMKAGCIGNHGYTVIAHKNKRVLGHRLIWWLVTGKAPHGFIDHINGVRTDNRFENLRVVTRTENNRNLTIQRRNTSGYPGVRQHEQTKRWRAEIRIDGKSRHLGYFLKKADAITAKLKAEKMHGFHVNHGKPCE